MNYWLIKSEPNTYSIDDLQKNKVDLWDGVRNYGARNNLRAMKKGDLALFYHSVVGKAVVGIAKVVKEHYPDPTADKKDADRWSVVDFEYVKHVNTPVTLEMVKKTPALKKMQLVTHSRLSVQEVKKEEFEEVLRLGETVL